jgi:flagellar biogenesis protein FliO
MFASASTLLLHASLLATTQVTISEVAAERDGGRLAITIKGDAMIDPEAASAKLADGALYLFVRDARVKEANRSWKTDTGDGPGEIRAHRHPKRVELVVPLGAGACQGPVEFDKAAGGLLATMSCDGGPRTSAGRAAPRVARAAKAEATEKVEPIEKAEATEKASPSPPSPSPSPSPSWARAPERQLVERKASQVLQPEPKAAPLLAALAPPPASDLAAFVAGAAATATATAAANAAATVPGQAHEAKPKGGSGSGNGSGSGSGGGSSVVLAGILLVALALGAFFFARKRSTQSRYIRILETASLGPKRSIVVARIGESTMILGSSEAGITLLKQLPDGPDRPARKPPHSTARAGDAMMADLDAHGSIPVDLEAIAARAMAREPSASASARPEEDEASSLPPPDLDDVAHPVSQGGLLARLFRRGTPANDSPPARFEDLLEDSIEDQELRRKLSLGLGGRTR